MNNREKRFTRNRGAAETNLLGGTRREPALAILVALLAGFAGCDSDSATSAAHAGEAKANTVAGRIMGEDGKPITAKGVKYSVAVNGISNAGEKVVYTPAVAADGSWKATVVAGTYHRPRATLKVPYEETAFTYHLVPSAPDGDFAAADGLVCNFTWKIRDAKPEVDTPNPDNWTHYFGAKVGVSFERFPKGWKGTGNLGPEGTKVRFTAVPTGKLIDGSEGTTKTYELAYDPLFFRTKPAALHNLPVGRYKVSAVVISAGGAEKPLLLHKDNDKEYQETIEITFYGYAGKDEPIGPTVWYTPKP